MELVQAFVLAYKFVFCNCAQSCKQTMTRLELTRCLKAFCSSLLGFCLSGDISGGLFSLMFLRRACKT